MSLVVEYDSEKEIKTLFDALLRTDLRTDIKKNINDLPSRLEFLFGKLKLHGTYVRTELLTYLDS